MGRRGIYTKEFKESAIELYHTSGKARKAIAEEFGIDPGKIYRWLRESGEEKTIGLKAFTGKGITRDEELCQGYGRK